MNENDEKEILKFEAENNTQLRTPSPLSNNSGTVNTVSIDESSLPGMITFVSSTPFSIEINKTEQDLQPFQLQSLINDPVTQPATEVVKIEESEENENIREPAQQGSSQSPRNVNDKQKEKGPSRLKCIFCGFVSSTMKDASQHRRRYHSKPYKER